jgi:glucans biosynthesis protein C
MNLATSLDSVPAEQSIATSVSRLLFIDNLRSSIIILVLLHHIAVIYSGSGSFYGLEYLAPGHNLLLVIFTGFNQAWFMGGLFLLSGYFSAGSCDRKGMRSFVKDRLIRLGIPLVFFYFVLNPIAAISIFWLPSSLTHITTPLTWQDYPHLVGWGPLWFVAMLLVFDFGYAGCRWLFRNHTSMANSGPPSYLAIGIFILALALVSYLIRIPLPINTTVFGFPDVAYFPQYLSFFCLGSVAFRGKWLQTIPGSMGKWGLVAAIVVTFTLFPVALIGVVAGSQPPLFGSGQWQSGVYALWDSTYAVGFFLALIIIFRRFLNRQGKLAKLLSQHSYTVYIIHPLILVWLAIALRGVNLDNVILLKFALLAVIAVPVCFAVAYLIKKIPLVSRVL